MTVQGKQTVSSHTTSPTGIRFGNLGPVELGQEMTTLNTDTGVLFGDGGWLWLPIPSPNNLFSFTAQSLDRTNRYGDGVFAMDADFKN